MGSFYAIPARADIGAACALHHELLANPQQTLDGSAVEYCSAAFAQLMLAAKAHTQIQQPSHELQADILMLGMAEFFKE